VMLPTTNTPVSFTPGSFRLGVWTRSTACRRAKMGLSAPRRMADRDRTGAKLPRVDASLFVRRS